MACKDDCWEGDYEEAKEQCGASWIDAVCEHKHRTVASSGRGWPLHQLARWSHDDLGAPAEEGWEMLLNNR